MFWDKNEKELQLAVLRRSSFWVVCKFVRPFIWILLAYSIYEGYANLAIACGILLYLTSRKFVYECVVKDVRS